MDDIIDDMRYDGKHSYEDVIMPVEDCYGIDLDFICRSSPEDVHRRSQAILERSAQRGSYALGTGNSVPEYIPPAKYFAMVSAATALDYSPYL